MVVVNATASHWEVAASSHFCEVQGLFASPCVWLTLSQLGLAVGFRDDFESPGFGGEPRSLQTWQEAALSKEVRQTGDKGDKGCCAQVLLLIFRGPNRSAALWLWLTVCAALLPEILDVVDLQLHWEV